MTKRLTFSARLAAAILLAATAASAVTFTAVRRTTSYELDAFDPTDTLTIDLPEGGAVAILTVPTDIFYLYGPWLPPVAILFNGADSRNADCDSPLIFEKYGVCEGLLGVRDGGDGRSTIIASKQTIMAAVEHLWWMHRRYETCKQTGGEEDIYYPNADPPVRCPPVSGIGGITPSGKRPGDRNNVVRPWWAMMLRIQADLDDFLGRMGYTFLIDTQELRRKLESEIPDPNQRPLDRHYGELDRMMAWFEYERLSYQAPEPETSAVAYDAASAKSILDAMTVLVDALSPRIGAGDLEESPHVSTIRQNVEQLKNRPEDWR